MTKKEYLYELYQAKLIARDEVSESEKDSDNVFKISIQGKTSVSTQYVKYNNGELSDEEIDRVIQLRQSSTLKNISGILTFFLVVFIIGVFIMVGSVLPIRWL